MGIKDMLKGSGTARPDAASEVSPKLANNPPRAKADVASASAGAGSTPSFGATSPAPPAATPDIADVFEVLLAEELGEVPAGQLHPYTIQLTDDLIDRISMRVIERLTKGPLSETMTRIVTEVSERLVREEITRIRASAQAKNS
jgi:hypothetical protein